MPRRVMRRRRQRRAARQIFKEVGLTSIKAQESYSVGANGLEIPSDRAFTALSLTLHLVSEGAIVCQVELWGPNNRPIWRCQPISVGGFPIRRTFRWPARAAAMWQSGSKDTIFKIICPCAGKIFVNSALSVNYTVTVMLSSDYDQQVCPKQHGVIERLADSFATVELVS